MKEFEWFEWFEWFGPSPIEPFNPGATHPCSFHYTASGYDWIGQMVASAMLEHAVLPYLKEIGIETAETSQQEITVNYV